MHPLPARLGAASRRSAEGMPEVQVPVLGSSAARERNGEATPLASLPFQLTVD